MARALLQAVLLVVLATTVHSRFIVEQGGIKVKFPVSARQKYPKGFDTSLANFGGWCTVALGQHDVAVLVRKHRKREQNVCVTSHACTCCRFAKVRRFYCVSHLSCHHLLLVHVRTTSAMVVASSPGHICAVTIQHACSQPVHATTAEDGMRSRLAGATS